MRKNYAWQSSVVIFTTTQFSLLFLFLFSLSLCAGWLWLFDHDLFDYQVIKDNFIRSFARSLSVCRWSFTCASSREMGFFICWSILLCRLSSFNITNFGDGFFFSCVNFAFCFILFCFLCGLRSKLQTSKNCRCRAFLAHCSTVVQDVGTIYRLAANYFDCDEKLRDRKWQCHYFRYIKYFSDALHMYARNQQSNQLSERWTCMMYKYVNV